MMKNSDYLVGIPCSKILAKLGFNEPCRFMENMQKPNELLEAPYPIKNRDYSDVKYLLVPYYDQALEFLRKKYNLSLSVMSSDEGYYSILMYTPEQGGSIIHSFNEYYKNYFDSLKSSLIRLVSLINDYGTKNLFDKLNN